MTREEFDKGIAAIEKLRAELEEEGRQVSMGEFIDILVSRQEYEGATIQEITWERYLEDLMGGMVEDGLLRVEGEGKDRVYFRGENFPIQGNKNFNSN